MSDEPGVFLCEFCTGNIKLTELTEEQANFYCCEDCLQQQIDKELEKTKKLDDNIRLYTEKLENIEKDIKYCENMSKPEFKQQVQRQEEQYDRELAHQIQIEKEQNNQLQSLKNQVVKLEIKEGEYWSKINNHQKNFVKLEEKIQQADSYLKKLNQDIDNIKKINVLNDVFHIFTEEQAGTINGLIIGKKKDQKQLDWDITNAGLGQLCVLMTYLVQKYGYKLQLIDYISCNGNYSTIQPKVQQVQGGQKKVPELNFYGPIPKETSEEQFNEAIKYFVLEFKLFTEYLEKQETIISKNIEIKLPYQIEGDTIIYANNKYSLNSLMYKEQKWDNWTQAFKYLLCNFKYLIEINAEHDCKAEEEYISAI